MPPRTAKQILAEWHELALRKEEATDAELVDAISQRIALVRREYIEGTPAPPAPDALREPAKDAPTDRR